MLVAVLYVLAVPATTTNVVAPRRRLAGLCLSTSETPEWGSKTAGIPWLQVLATSWVRLTVGAACGDSSYLYVRLSK